jgi:tetratricopeptide (TPR) repeat protein
MSEGFDARAVAVFKQIQNLDPDRYASYLPLAELYQRMGLTSEAIQALQTAADGMHRHGQKREALELLRKMASLDPTNTASRVKVGDLLKKEGLAAEALQEYEAACAELERQGADETAESVLGRVLELEPGHLGALTQLARNLLKRGFAERAEPFARRALEAEPDEAAHFELLADVYRAQQRDAELTDTYKKLADLYRQRGDEDRAREITQRFVPPDDLGASLETAARGAESEDLVRDVGMLGDDSTLLDDGFLDDEAEAARMERPAKRTLAEETLLELSDEPRSSKPAQPVRRLDEEIALDEPEGEPDQLLAEASVYLRYGKRAQAVRNLTAVLEREPEHRGALEKLGEAHADAGDAAAAVEVWLRAAEAARREEDLEGLAVLRDRIAALDAAAAASLGIGPAEPETDLEEIVDLETDADLDAGGEVPEPEPEDDIEIELEGFDDEDAAGPARAPAARATPAAAKAPPARPAPAAGRKGHAAEGSLGGASVSASQQINENLEEAEFYRQQGLLDEAAAIYERVLEVAPSHPLALVRMGEIAAARGDDPGATASGRAAPAPADDEDAAADAASDLGRDLAEWSDAGLSEESLRLDGDDIPDPELDDSVLASIDDVEEPMLSDPGADLDVSAPRRKGPAVEPLAVDEEELDLTLDDDPDEDTPADADDTTGVDVAEAGDEMPASLSGEDGAGFAIGEEGEPGLDTDAQGRGFEIGAAALPAATRRGRGAPAPDPHGDSFDLAAELSEALEDDDGASTGSFRSNAEADVFAAVFSEFKKGVSATLGEGDQEAHYDLGIAYREMGLLDDALGEFRTAMSKPARRVDCLHMLGLCLVDLGRAGEAVQQFQQALAAPGTSDEQRLAVNFELGVAYERLGELEKARGAWEAVTAVDPSFCAVEERIANLGQAPPAAAESGYESFRDLFDESDDPERDPDDTAEADTAEQTFESFEDLEDGLDDDDATDSGRDDAAVALDPDETLEPEPEPEPPPRRRKKISFV